jgi:hypothetical protein
MMQQEILARAAGVYADTADPLGISFTTARLFQGTLADCLAMVGRTSGPVSANTYIETEDGGIHLDPSDIAAMLGELAV